MVRALDICTAAIKSASRPLAAIAVVGMVAVGNASAAAAIDVSKAESMPVSAGPGKRAVLPNDKIAPGKGLYKNSVDGTGAYSKFYNWEGYAATGSTYNAVQSTYVQPSVTCTVPGAWTVWWVGFDGYSNGTVEQAGTAARCSTGTNPTPTYYSWWEMYPTNTIQTTPLAVKPGDTVQARVTYTNATAKYNMTVNNITTGGTFTQQAQCAANLTCSRNSAEIIGERPSLNGVYQPLAKWNTGTFRFDSAQVATTSTVNATTGAESYNYVNINSTANTPIVMVNYSDATRNLASPSTFGSAGNWFDNYWYAAQ